jgi:hypothetical protein
VHVIVDGLARVYLSTKDVSCARDEVEGMRGSWERREVYTFPCALDQAVLRLASDWKLWHGRHVALSVLEEISCSAFEGVELLHDGGGRAARAVGYLAVTFEKLGK